MQIVDDRGIFKHDHVTAIELDILLERSGSTKIGSQKNLYGYCCIDKVIISMT